MSRFYERFLMNRSVICGVAGLAMVVAMGLSSVDSTATAQAGCGGLFGGKACGGLFGGHNRCGGLFQKKACGGGLFARLKARRAAKACCAPAPTNCCPPAPADCCTPAPCDPCATTTIGCGSGCGTMTSGCGGCGGTVMTTSAGCCGGTVMSTVPGTVMEGTVIEETVIEGGEATSESASDVTNEAPPEPATEGAEETPEA
jgi:hypothetical protein